MANNDAIHFGTAYIDVKARLDDYDRQMQEAEQRRHEVTVQNRRQPGGDGGGNLFTNQQLAPSFDQRLQILGLTLSATSTRMQVFMRLVTGTASALARWAVPVLLVFELGNIVRLVRALPDAAQNAYNWLSRLTLKGLVADTTSWIDNVARKIPGIAMLWRGLAETVSQASEGLGGSNFTRDLRELEKAAEAAENRLDALNRAANLTRDQSLGQPTVTARRSRILEGLTGSATIRAQGQFDLEDIREQGRTAARTLTAAYDEQIKQLRQERDAEAITADQFKEQEKILTDRRIGIMRQHDADISRAMIESQRLTRERVARFERENMMQHAAEIEALQRQLAIESIQTEGDGLQAQAETIRMGYRFQIMDAVREGETQRAQLLDQIAAARIAAIARRAEQERRTEAEQATKQNAENITRERDRVRDAATQLNRVRAELGGATSSQLQIFDINADADQRSVGIRRQIEDLRAAQREFRSSLPYGLVTDDQFAKNNEFAAQIDALERLLELTEALRQKRIELVRQREGEGRQISGHEAIFYMANQAGARATGQAPGEGTGREQVRQQQISNEKLERIHRAIERGGIAVLG